MNGRVFEYPNISRPRRRRPTFLETALGLAAMLTAGALFPFYLVFVLYRRAAGRFPRLVPWLVDNVGAVLVGILFGYFFGCAF